MPPYTYHLTLTIIILNRILVSTHQLPAMHAPSPVPGSVLAARSLLGRLVTTWSEWVLPVHIPYLSIHPTCPYILMPLNLMVTHVAETVSPKMFTNCQSSPVLHGGLAGVACLVVGSRCSHGGPGPRLLKSAQWGGLHWKRGLLQPPKVEKLRFCVSVNRRAKLAHSLRTAAWWLWACTCLVWGPAVLRLACC